MEECGVLDAVAISHFIRSSDGQSSILLILHSMYCTDVRILSLFTLLSFGDAVSITQQSCSRELSWANRVRFPITSTGHDDYHFLDKIYPGPTDSSRTPSCSLDLFATTSSSRPLRASVISWDAVIHGPLGEVPPSLVTAVGTCLCRTSTVPVLSTRATVSCHEG